MGLHPTDRVAEHTAAGLWGVRSWPGLLAAAVAEVAVIGVPDPVLGERTRAVVSLHPDQTLTVEQLVDFLRASHIASYKLPESLSIVDALPRNPISKVLERELRDQAIHEDPPLLAGGNQ